MILFGASARAAIHTEPPIHFFTNVASRLLRSEMGLDLNRIPVYPTNRYSAAAHRLMQLTANLHDSTTTNVFPTLFRPVFALEDTNVFISGFEEVDATNGEFLSLPLNLEDAGDRSVLATHGRVNVFGIPWIVGVKRGIPNFNEVAVSSVFDVTRQVLVKKPAQVAPASSFAFEQRLVMNLENQIGIEMWNSSTNPFPGGVQIDAVFQADMVLTNSGGYAVTNHWSVSGSVSIDSWSGRGTAPGAVPESLVVPLQTNVVLLKDAVWNQAESAFMPTNEIHFEPISFTTVRWGFEMEGRVRVIIWESGTGRVIDYLQLKLPRLQRDLTEDIRTTGDGVGGLWNTNVVGSSPSLPEGVHHQVRMGLGDPAVAADWREYGINQLPPGNARDKEVAWFRAFYFSGTVNYNGVIAQNPTNLVAQVPFTPTQKTMRHLALTANDPLVHHHGADLWDSARSSFLTAVMPPWALTNSLPGIGRLNERYEPWGGNPNHPQGAIAATSLAFKDPRVGSADDWDFPQGEPLALESIGRIHRGTPWQTIYLKSTNAMQNSAGLARWIQWTGNTDTEDAMRTIPVSDHRLVDLLAPLLQTNDVRELHSINSSDAARWMSVLDGLVILSNSVPEASVTISSNFPQTTTLVDAITESRASLPGGYFRTLADLLSVPDLSVGSPFLSFVPETLVSPSDAALESLPAQLLSRLRVDSIGAGTVEGEFLHMRFSGYDDYDYAVESSSDLLNWTAVSTNRPADGSFTVTVPRVETEPRFYRSSMILE